MSTRATISVRIKDEDLDKTMKIDIEKFGLTPQEMEPHKLWFDDSLVISPKLVAEKAHPVTLTEKYITVYHHSDGYPDGVGGTLRKNYSDYDKALNLLLGGDISSAVSSSFPTYYLTRDKWEDCKPKLSPSHPYPDGDREYSYVFEDGRWMVYCLDGNQYTL